MVVVKKNKTKNIIKINYYCKTNKNKFNNKSGRRNFKHDSVDVLVNNYR